MKKNICLKLKIISSNLIRSGRPSEALSHIMRLRQVGVLNIKWNALNFYNIPFIYHRL